MFLDLSKALCFFLCILSLYHASIHAFFVPGTRWEERLLLALVRLALAACICFFSGLVFTWPIRTNPDRGQHLIATLPVRLFLWSTACMVALFLSSWFLADLAQQAGPFISSHSLQRF
jgi:hypothetical protein